ncbi:bromodomain-containing protein [Gossypium australe]|uniref:Bromodomain-containing protein n=1 Tax=Gossypium australe TaxID=47621 RepID=A0A5B6UIW8_9ROSI|nr:bromodomain-containing protein [Gossypium australe]
MPLVEAIEQMSNYVNFMKDILLKKKRHSEFNTVALTKECNMLLQNKLPPKLKDPGNFIIPCNSGESYCGKALCDLGTSINLMPKSILKMLGIGEVKPTTVTLQLVDRSLAYPEGKIEDVLVRVDKIFPIDFIVLDFEADKEVPVILGRPFLTMGRTLIDKRKGEFTIRVQDYQVTFNVLKAMKFPDPVEECSVPVELESLVSIEWECNSVQDPLENTFGSEPLIDEQGKENMALMEVNLNDYKLENTRNQIFQLRNHPNLKLSRTNRTPRGVKSTSGCVFVLGGSGSIAWRSVKQNYSVDSTMEVKYVAASKATKEVMLLQKFVTDLEVVLGMKKAITLYCDNSAAIANTKETRNHKITKHIDQKYHIIKEAIADEIVDVLKVAFEDNLVGPFTKTLPVRIFEKYVERWGMWNMTHLLH